MPRGVEPRHAGGLLIPRKFIETGATTGGVNVPNVELAPSPGTHRVLAMHRNMPGVLRDINRIPASPAARWCIVGAVEAPLRRVWQARTLNPIFDAPIAGDTTVLAQSVHEVYGFWARDGALRWQFSQTGGRWTQWVLRTRFGPVVHGSVDGHWRVVGLGFDGTPRWSLPAERHGTVGAPARDGRGLWLAVKHKGGRSEVRRVDRDGAVVAKYDALDHVTHLLEVEGALLLAGDHHGTEGLYRMALPSGDIARVWSGATEFVARHAAHLRE